MPRVLGSGPRGPTGVVRELERYFLNTLLYAMPNEFWFMLMASVPPPGNSGEVAPVTVLSKACA